MLEKLWKMPNKLIADISPEFREQMLGTFLVFTVILGLRYIVSYYVFRHVHDIKSRYRTQKVINIFASTLIFFAVGRIWIEGISSFATVLGLFAAGVAVALKDPLANLVGWLFIVTRRPFELGHRIQIGEHKGDVIDVRLFQFTILEVGAWVAGEQSTGRIIHVPNGKVFTDYQINYNQGFSHIWNEVNVLFTFESNWKKAKEILSKILEREEFQLEKRTEEQLRETSKQFMIFYSKLTPIVYTSVKDSGVLLTLRYLCDPKKCRTTEEQIWEYTLAQVAENDDIDLAYNTIRYFEK